MGGGGGGERKNFKRGNIIIIIIMWVVEIPLHRMDSIHLYSFPTLLLTYTCRYHGHPHNSPGKAKLKTNMEGGKLKSDVYYYIIYLRKELYLIAYSVSSLLLGKVNLNKEGKTGNWCNREKGHAMLFRHVAST